MRKVISIFGIMFLILVFVVGGLFAYFSSQGSKLDASSKSFVDEVIPVIISTWSKEIILKHSSQQMRQTAAEAQLDLLLKKVSILGQLLDYKTANGEALISFTKNGKMVTANYSVKARFQNGLAEINIRLIQYKGAWEILGFQIESPLFLK